MRASAAAHLARREQAASPVAALEEIASTSAEALGELRAALKGLRSDDSEGVLLRPPGAGLADLDDLIAGVEGAGLTVELEMAAAAATVPPAIGHAGYRIVQEGLTNVLRHSTAKHARVRIGRDEGALLVEVLDDGQARAATGTGDGVTACWACASAPPRSAAAARPDGRRAAAGGSGPGYRSTRRIVDRPDQGVSSRTTIRWSGPDSSRS